MTKTLKRLIEFSFLLLIFLALGFFCAIIKINTSQEKKLNIIWIVVDALRADHLSCYGYERHTSPFIDEFANKNILFKYAFSQESYTQASVASFFTSTYPWGHKVLYDEPTIDILDPRFITIAEILKEANYNTAAFVFNPHLKAEFNFGQGFDLYDSKEENFSESLPKYEAYETAKKIFDKVKHYLEGIKNKNPVFLYLHYRDVHTPYAPPPPYDKIFPVSKVHALRMEKMQTEKNRVESEICMYDGEIRYTDDYIKKTLRMLEEHHINRMNSIIIITADHGEEFCDSHPPDPGDGGHGRTLYNEQVQVPLIMSIPGVCPQKKTIDTYVGLIDIIPTICDILRIDWRKYGQFQGRSLLPVIKGIDKNSSVIYGGGKYGRGFVIEDGYKYYVDTQYKTDRCERPFNNDHIMHEELYDLKTDFNETKDLLNEKPTIALKLKKKLELCIKESSSNMGTGKSAELDAQTKEELKSLGYLQ
jgi:arylsulfatase A-like enzyme